ncbi:AfsR/SARP family transcriptional regulator [Streptomyces sp. CA-250714]|uniref:AfsR/SARP family transcriptional regulator n=1 Tax=Streptomyces sp. CA-250714 TaxID=3240060 RepID=UPI003D8B1670
MQFGVLGPLRVWSVQGHPVTVPEAKVRTLLSALLAAEGQAVSTDRLIDALWGVHPPRSPSNSLQTKVSQLRRALDTARPGARQLLTHGPAGYQLRMSPDEADAGLFTQLLARARAMTDPAPRAKVLDEALGLWRGRAYAEVADEPFARATADRLEEQRLTAIEDRAEARLALGEHRELADELAEVVGRHPLRERLRALQLRALYRAGRQGEALAGYAELRARLAEELGVDPGPELAALHQAMLTQDPALDAAPQAPPAPSPSPSPYESPLSTSPTYASPLSTPQPYALPLPSPHSHTSPLSTPPTHAPYAARPPWSDSGIRDRAHRSNLPAPVSGLVGREEAVREIGELFGAGRLVTLTGPGGVGKTRLAVETAHRLLDSRPDGVWLVELAALSRHVSDPACQLAETVTAVLDIREDPAFRPLPRNTSPGQDPLTLALRGRTMTLVLDNCEHLIDVVAEAVTRWLRAVPGLTVLATSQEPLGVEGETIWTVPPLEHSDAVELFTTRAAASAPGLVIDEAHAEAVDTICRRLDGIPLALELAATRVRALGLHTLSCRLDDRFSLLAGGRRGVPQRQQTLRAMIEWSWELCTEPERALLRRLSAHADGATLEAVEAVCSGGAVPRDRVPELLARLVDRSQVVMTEGPDGPRYRMLESVGAYAAEQLASAGDGEADRIRQAHREHYLAFAELAEPALYGPGQHETLERLDRESANLRRAFHTAVQDGAAPHALRLANSLAWYWYLRGRFREAHRLSDLALGLGAEAPEPIRAEAAVWRAGMAIIFDHETSLLAKSREALARYARLAQPTRSLAWAQWFLAFTQWGMGDHEARDRQVDAALDAFRAAGDRWGTAAALCSRSFNAQERADLAASVAAGRESLELFTELGDRWGQLQAAEALGSAAEITGDYDEAARLRRISVEVAEELGLWAQLSEQLSALGRVALLRGDYAEADALHERGRRMAVEQAHPAGEQYAEIGLALSARRQGRYDDCERFLRRWLNVDREAEAHAGVALILAELGFVAELRGDADAAMALHQEGKEAAELSGDPRAVALALEGLAGAHTAAGHPTEAARLLGRAAALRASVGVPLPSAERGDVDRITAAALAALGTETFATAHADGAAAAARQAG